MWTVTTKRRDIWTWLSCWGRRNHGWWVIEMKYSVERSRDEHCVSSVPVPLWLQEYETTRKELEGVKKERDEAKRQLSALKQAQAPMLRKIQLIENQLKPTEAQIKAKVRIKPKKILVLSDRSVVWYVGLKEQIQSHISRMCMRQTYDLISHIKYNPHVIFVTVDHLLNPHHFYTVDADLLPLYKNGILVIGQSAKRENLISHLSAHSCNITSVIGYVNLEKWRKEHYEARAISFTGQRWKPFLHLLFTLISIAIILLTGSPKNTIKHLQLSAHITHIIKSRHWLPISYTIVF